MPDLIRNLAIEAVRAVRPTNKEQEADKAYYLQKIQEIGRERAKSRKPKQHGAARK